jgi:hypothetical protein
VEPTATDGWLNTAPSPLNQYVTIGYPNAYDGFGCGINQSFPCESEEAKKWNPLLYTNALFGDVIHIDSNGSDKNLCGNVSFPCNFMREGIKHFKTDGNHKTFLIETNIGLDSELSISSGSTNIPSLTIQSNESTIVRTLTIEDKEC